MLFLSGPDPTILDQMINILRRESLITSVHQHSESFHADVDLMSSAITLVYNLAFDKTILSMLKENEFDRICDKLHTARDRTIKFASKTLSARLNQGNIDEINGPLNLALNYLFHIENAINVSSLIYRGIKLDGILANLEGIGFAVIPIYYLFCLRSINKIYSASSFCPKRSY